MNIKFFLAVVVMVGAQHVSAKHERTRQIVRQWTLGIPKSYDISVEMYPHATSYFARLRQRYPAALHHKIKIKMTDLEQCSPYCIGSTIVFPKDWLFLLEERNYETELLTEWVILHESMHARCRHSVKSVLCNYIQVVSFLKFIYPRFKAEPDADRYANEHCCNPEAMKAAIRFLKKYQDRAWYEDLNHPTAKKRIKEIEKALRVRFGM